MSSRIKGMRTKLLEELELLGKSSRTDWYQYLLTSDAECPKNFQHIVDQRGMFCILGLTLNQVNWLQGA